MFAEKVYSLKTKDQHQGEIPKYPDFKEIKLEDKPIFDLAFKEYQPDISELTFTSLFAWKDYYHVSWCCHEEYLLMLVAMDDGTIHAVPPIGPASRNAVSQMLMQFLKDRYSIQNPKIERADKRLVSELACEQYRVVSDTDQFDYVYAGSDLINLAGRKYHAKKNHLNRFLKNTNFKLEVLDASNIAECYHTLHDWCDYHECQKNKEIIIECDASRMMLKYYTELKLTGLAIRVNGRIEAFTIGEMLNQQTAVIHLEKANAEIPGLYTAINQMFCKEFWADVPWINREQDNGDSGLRKAKSSYNPSFMIEKFRLTRI